MQRWKRTFDGGFDAFNTGGICHGCGGRQYSGGAVRVAGAAIEIDAGATPCRVTAILHCSPASGAMEDALCTLSHRNVLTANDSCRRELQRQQREHQNDKESAHQCDFKRQV